MSLPIECEIINTAESLGYTIRTAITGGSDLKPPLIPEDKRSEINQQFNPALLAFVNSCINGLTDPRIFKLLTRLKDFSSYYPFRLMDNYWIRARSRIGDIPIVFISKSEMRIHDDNTQSIISLNKSEENINLLFYIFTESTPIEKVTQLIQETYPTPEGESEWVIEQLQDSKGLKATRRFLGSDILNDRDLLKLFLGGIQTIATSTQEIIKMRSESINEGNRESQRRIDEIKKATLMVQSVIRK